MEFADLMKEGSLFHSLVAVTVNVRSPALLRVNGMVNRNLSIEERRLGRDGLRNVRQSLIYVGI